MKLNFLRNLDIFGSTVQINFRGKVKQGTLVGGIGTILSSILIFTYFVFSIIKLVSKEPVSTKT